MAKITNSYHHGNLKKELIQTGKKMIRQDGLKSFSLRKVAETCNVSYAAPKNHFNDKSELIKAIQDDIANDFTNYLKTIYEDNKEDENILIMLGEGYVKFFIENPHYYSLFFQETAIPETVHMKNDGSIASNFKPFTFYMKIATDFLSKHGVPAEDINEYILSMWSLVHGISSISAYSFFTYHGDILELTKRALARYVIAKNIPEQPEQYF